jgi:hypothetical protein
MSYIILLVLANDILVLVCSLLPLVALSILQLAIVDWFSYWYGMGLLVVLYNSVPMVEWRNLGWAFAQDHVRTLALSYLTPTLLPSYPTVLTQRSHFWCWSELGRSSTSYSRCMCL